MPNTGPSAGSRRQTIARLPSWFRRIAQTDRGGGLALAGRRRGDRGDQDQLAVGPVGELRHVVQGDLGLVVPVGLEALLRDAQPLARQRHDRAHLRALGDLDVAQGAAVDCDEGVVDMLRWPVRNVEAVDATRGPRRGFRLVTIQPMLWLKAFHVVFVVTWFAGLFYLPRLFVYHVGRHRCGRDRALRGHGAAPVLHHERSARCWRCCSGMAMIVECARLSRAGLDACQAAAGGGAGRLPRLVLPADAGAARRASVRTRSAGTACSTNCPALLLVAIVVLAVVKP